MDDLKKRAIELDVDFLMHMDKRSGMVWVTHNKMDNEAENKARENGVKLSDNITILDIEFPGMTDTQTQDYQIRFNRQGYSDFAFIHIIENKSNITLKIEPFLSRVQLINRHIHHEDCI